MNSIDRVYRVRGKQVHLQELTDLAAVRSGEVGAEAAVASSAPEAALPQVRAFEDAGWSFVPRQQAADGARVYLRPSGRVALGTNRLTVRLTGSRTEAEARDVLESLGVTVLDRIKFAPNLFVVAVPPGQDVVEAAERLTVSGEVEFAEPELIEIISGR